MLTAIDKKDCSGCYACVNVCPINCITMHSDAEGFWYPQIEKDSCTKCGQCQVVCPALHPADLDRTKLPAAYAGINKDSDMVNKSSSGGIFALIAEYVISLGGVVFGAAFNEALEVQHIAIEDIDGLSKLQGSKYVQSKIGDAYQSVKAYLRQNRYVLFTGTPCQVMGLRTFLKKNYEKLICQDIICHGVPSPLLWKKYIDYREEQAGAKLLNVFFRSKVYGWKQFAVKCVFDNNTEYVKPHDEDSYMKMFLFNHSLRPSCYSCRFKGVNRIADVTLADFWHVDKYAPGMFHENGVSLIFLHTEKGRKLFEQVSDKLRWQAIEDPNVGLKNFPMVCSVRMPKTRRSFFNKVYVDNIDVVAKRYGKATIGRRLKASIKSLLNKALGQN